MKTQSSLLVSLFSALALLLAGCGGEQENPQASAPAEDGSTALSETIVLAEAPPEATPVGQARQKFQPEQAIAVVGQVGGTLKPISESFASFVIADEEVYFCDEMPEDHCSTPWDACCENPDKLAANRASVVFVDGEGQPLRGNLKDSLGLAELDKVAVKGKVAPESTPGNLVIHATGLYSY